eukprot:2073220-Pyramimonas_sp.AAC.1
MLCTMRPAHRLIAADFDALPDVVTIPGRNNAPLVASKVWTVQLSPCKLEARTVGVLWRCESVSYMLFDFE